jgi:hypothetical protein
MFRWLTGSWLGPGTSDAADQSGPLLLGPDWKLEPMVAPAHRDSIPVRREYVGDLGCDGRHTLTLARGTTWRLHRGSHAGWLPQGPDKVKLL